MRARPGSVTIRDVARRAGVSIATVSRYINQNAPFSAKVVARLKAIMAELDYVPHATARSLATHTTHMIGLALAAISGDFFTPLLAGVEAVTRENGYDLLISSTGPVHGRDHPNAPVGPHNSDGLLVFSNSLDAAALGRLAADGFPVVLIHQSSPRGLDIPCVTVENTSAVFQIVSHLIEAHGRRRIALLRGPAGHEDSQLREEGYRQALESHGIPIDPALISAGGFSQDVARDSIERLIAMGVSFDAVFSGDDIGAAGTLAGLQTAGLRVPQDVSVVGFDDQRLAAFMAPPLSTVHAPTESVGRTAAEVLLTLIRTGTAEPVTRLPTRIVLRRSCGCGG